MVFLLQERNISSRVFCLFTPCRLKNKWISSYNWTCRRHTLVVQCAGSWRKVRGRFEKVSTENFLIICDYCIIIKKDFLSIKRSSKVVICWFVALDRRQMCADLVTTKKVACLSWSMATFLFPSFPLVDKILDQDETPKLKRDKTRKLRKKSPWMHIDVSVTSQRYVYDQVHGLWRKGP